MALGINVEYFCIHTQNGLAKSLTKRITCLIDHYHRIAVNIMLASYGLTHRKLNSNSYNCNQNNTPRCSKYVDSWPQPNISHLHVGYISHIPISPPQHTFMGIEDPYKIFIGHSLNILDHS